MSFRGSPRYVKEVPFEPFPEIEGLGTAEYSITQIQMVKWSTNQNKDCHLSPYYWEDISESPTTLLSTSYAESDAVIQLRPRSGAVFHRVKGIDCLSWRLAVETNNLQAWKLVPESCEKYVGNYMLGKQYRRDCEAVADAAIEYAKGLKLAGDGKDVWVFDIDETTLSNIPYYARSDVQFGAIAYNDTKFNNWVAEGTSPPVPAIRRLYKTVLSLGFKTVFLSGTAQKFKDIRILNLHEAGYYNWEKLILKGDGDKGMSAVAYKSKQGYRIVGNVGDQWSDLIGENVGNRTFKVPDPMYYIG